jgi:hypothetical protein
MKKHTASILAVMGAVLVALLVVIGFSIVNSQTVSADPIETSPPVTTPIAPPHATVAPEVATKMNGKPAKVRMARGIKMHAPQKGLTSLAGNGQGTGCVKDYGKPQQCLPLVSPAQASMPDMEMPWTCADVVQLFPKGIAVKKGKDTLKLDSNGDGVACGRGDG